MGRGTDRRIDREREGEGSGHEEEEFAKINNDIERVFRETTL